MSLVTGTPCTIVKSPFIRLRADNQDAIALRDVRFHELGRTIAGRKMYFINDGVNTIGAETPGKLEHPSLVLFTVP
jgi:hypothetical protein